MIRISDAAILAGTKLKTRRVRMAITSIIAGLLFIAAICMSLLVNGVINSVDKFNSEGYGSRYLVSLNTDQGLYGNENFEQLQNDEKLQAELELKYTAYKKDKTAYAKSVGAEYDPKSEPALFDEFDGFKNPNFNISIINDYLSRNQAKESEVINAAANEISDAPEVVASYEVVTIGGSDFGPTNTQSGEQEYNLNPIIDGKEFGLESRDAQEYNSYGQPNPLEAFTDSLGVADDRLTQPLYFDGIDVSSITAAKRVPIIAPYEAVQEILGLEPYKDDSDVTSEQRLERYRQVREDARGLKFSVCVRNQSSINSLSKAQETQSQLQLATKDSKLQKPTLVLEAGTDPCSGTTVTKDTRTAEEKKLTLAQEKLAAYDSPELLAEPTQRLVEFEIVGIMQGSRTDISSFSVASIVRELISTRPFGYQIQWAIPETAIVSALPELSSRVLAQQNSIGSFGGEPVKIIELQNAAQVTELRDKFQCDYGFGEFTDASKFESKINTCKEQGRVFSMSPFGSNSVALDEVKRIFNNIFKWVLIVITVISSVILIGIVGKIISDSRRETAVFRAIGAKRFDIAQIYLTYSFLLGSIIAVIATLIGSLLIGLVHSRYSSGLSVDAVIAYGSQDLNKSFELYAVNPKQLATIILAIVGAALLSALLPLLTNLRRNPIKDMRDER